MYIHTRTYSLQTACPKACRTRHKENLSEAIISGPSAAHSLPAFQANCVASIRTPAQMQCECHLSISTGPLLPLQGKVSTCPASHLIYTAMCRLRGCHYKLVAVIEHLGGPLSGHYITYRQVQARQWAYTSDTSVHSSSLTEVLGSIPYMLFYQQVKF